MEKQLSIIIPVYNGERYIAACLTPLLGQLTEQHEVILINDGSTDATHEIISREFSASIEQGGLVYLSVENGGVSVARNRGLDRAKGRYVTFVDADDMVSPDYLASLDKAIEQAPDVIEFGYRSVDMAGQPLGGGRHVHSRFGLHVADAVRDDVFAAGIWYPWLRAFRCELFADIRFPPGVRFCEDVMAISQVYKKADSILTLPDVLYDYRVNTGGATLNVKPDYVSNLLAFYRQIDSSASFSDKALKVTIAYAMRSCLVKSTDPLGRLPGDVEADVRRFIFVPRLLWMMRPRFFIFGTLGPAIFYIKRWLR